MALNIDRWMAQGQSMALSRELRANLGGTAIIDLTNGDHFVTVPDECQNLRLLLTGALFGNRTCFLPRLSGYYFIDVQATSAFTITLAVRDGQTLAVTNGQKLIVFVEEVSGTLENFGTGGGSGGSGAQVSINYMSSPYTVPGAYDTIYVDTATSNPTNQPVSLILPNAAANGMREITIIGTAPTNSIAITSVGGLMNLLPSFVMNMIFGVGNSMTFKSDSTNWWSK